MKYLMWAVTTIRDIIAYNEHEVLVGMPLDRIERELILIETKEAEYSKKNFMEFHKDMVDMGITSLPTTEKAIRRFGE